MSTMKNKRVDLKEKQGCRLDIGCGTNKNPGFVGIDILDLPGVDIVWDLEIFPWPLDDECVLIATASHVLEHINPHKGVFIKFMNEVWRVMKPEGQFAIVVPYGVNEGFVQDPTHCNPINETTMHYFDPDPEGRNIGQQLYGFYRPKPWKIVTQFIDPESNLEILLEKRRWDVSFGRIMTPTDITKQRLYDKRQR